MDHTHCLDVGVFVQFGRQSVQVRGLAPGRVHYVNFGPATRRDIGQPVSEETVAADDHGVPALQDVGAGGFHGAGAGG